MRELPYPQVNPIPFPNPKPEVLSDGQRAFMESTAQTKGFSGERRAGKTFIGALNLLSKIEPNKSYLVMSPKYMILTACVIPAIVRWFGHPVGLISKSNIGQPIKFTFDNGAVIEFHTADKLELLRGKVFESGWMDDADFMDWEHFRECRYVCKNELSLTFGSPDAKPMLWLIDVFGLPCSNVSLVRSKTQDNPTFGTKEVPHVYAGLSGKFPRTMISASPSLEVKGTGVSGGTFTLKIGEWSTKPIPYNASPQVIQEAINELVNLPKLNPMGDQIPTPYLDFYDGSNPKPFPYLGDFREAVAELGKAVAVPFCLPPNELKETKEPKSGQVYLVSDNGELKLTDNPIHDSPKRVGTVRFLDGHLRAVDVKGSLTSGYGSGGGLGTGSSGGSGCGSSRGTSDGSGFAKGSISGSGDMGWITEDGGMIRDGLVSGSGVPRLIGRGEGRMGMDMATGQDQTKAILVEEKERQIVPVWDKPYLHLQAVVMAEHEGVKPENQPPTEDDSEPCDTPIYTDSGTGGE